MKENRIKKGDWVRVNFRNSESYIFNIIYCPTESDHFWECADHTGNPVIIMHFDIMYKVKVKQLPDGTYEQDYDHAELRQPLHTRCGERKR
jgi:hypothetical protein